MARVCPAVRPASVRLPLLFPAAHLSVTDSGVQRAQGTVTFTPDDPSGISASGHFASWFGESGNNKNDVQHDTFNLVLTDTDGSHVVVHETSHLSTNAAGVVTVVFDKMTVSCAG
jgi:hypothetical protein